MILVAGSSNLDFVVQAHHIPAPGETVLGRDFKTFPGGKGANQAVACARAGGVATAFLTAMGDDAFANPIETSLREASVHTYMVRSTEHPTGTAFICVSDAAENAITVAPGANLSLQAEHLPSLQGISHLLMQLEIPLATVAAYASAARQQGVCVVLNAAPVQELSAALLKNIDVLVVNEGELATLSRHNGTIAECLEHIAVPTVVVTLGHRGACARIEGNFLVQPAYPITPIDTTAAGDSFCGGLVAALSQGLTLRQALQLAGASGAMACTRLGAQSSIPKMADVADFLAQQPAASAASLDALGAYCGLPVGTYS
jgi:ribokinase